MEKKKLPPKFHGWLKKSTVTFPHLFNGQNGHAMPRSPIHSANVCQLHRAIQWRWPGRNVPTTSDSTTRVVLMSTEVVQMSTASLTADCQLVIFDKIFIIIYIYHIFFICIVYLRVCNKSLYKLIASSAFVASIIKLLLSCFLSVDWCASATATLEVFFTWLPCEWEWRSGAFDFCLGLSPCWLTWLILLVSPKTISSPYCWFCQQNLGPPEQALTSCPSCNFFPGSFWVSSGAPRNQGLLKTTGSFHWGMGWVGQ